MLGLFDLHDSAAGTYISTVQAIEVDAALGLISIAIFTIPNDGGDARTGGHNVICLNQLSFQVVDFQLQFAVCFGIHAKLGVILEGTGVYAHIYRAAHCIVV